MTANCLCGATSVTIAAKPDFIHDCNCGLCRKVGAAWGSFSNAQVSTTGETTAFMRRDKPNAGVEVKSCQTCGSTTHLDSLLPFRPCTPKLTWWASTCGCSIRKSWWVLKCAIRTERTGPVMAHSPTDAHP